MEASVIRRSAMTASASVASRSGGVVCHQATTGASAASSGRTTDSACSPSRPYMRMTTASPGPSRPPIDTSASSRGTGASICRRTTTSSRQGCISAACVAASSASDTLLSSATTTRVSATPDSTAPPVRRWAASSLTTAVPLVSHSVVMTSPRRSGGSRSPPPASLGLEHLVGRPGAPLAGPVRVRGGAGPELLERVDRRPRRLHLRVAGEERRVAEQNVEQQPLVGLGGGLGELLAVEEVNGHVPDLHHAARNLRPELEGDPFVGLHPDDELVVAQLLGVGVAERQVRRALEHQRDLGDPPRQPLARAQVERHPGPATGLHAEADGGVGLGERLRVDALLRLVAVHPVAGQPALLVLPADGEGGQVVGQRDRLQHLELLGG